MVVVGRVVVGSDGSSGNSSSSSIIDGGRVGTGMKLWGRTKASGSWNG